MGYSSRLSNFISTVAAVLYFLFIILQIPLFRMPCRSVICTTPIAVTSSQLLASQIVPVSMVKLLLYPGAAANAVVKSTRIPAYNELLDVYSLSHVKRTPSVTDILHLEILVGSYLSVAGAFLGLLKARGGCSKLSFFGLLILSWGLIKEIFWSYNNNGESTSVFQVYPSLLLLALLLALLCARGDLRKVVRSFRAKQAAMVTDSTRNYGFRLHLYLRDDA